MPELKWRVVTDAGKYIEWEDEITLPDGTVKRASIDDIDRSDIAQLLTVDRNGLVLHALTFPKAERNSKKRAVWRLTRKINVPEGIPVTVGALTGYNELLSGSLSSLTLSFVDAETGEVKGAEGFEIELHPREVFDPAEAAEIAARQEEQNVAAEADNDMLANPITEDDGNGI